MDILNSWPCATKTQELESHFSNPLCPPDLWLLCSANVHFSLKKQRRVTIVRPKRVFSDEKHTSGHAVYTFRKANLCFLAKKQLASSIFNTFPQHDALWASLTPSHECQRLKSWSRTFPAPSVHHPGCSQAQACGWGGPGLPKWAPANEALSGPHHHWADQHCACAWANQGPIRIIRR